LNALQGDDEEKALTLVFCQIGYQPNITSQNNSATVQSQLANNAKRAKSLQISLFLLLSI